MLLAVAMGFGSAGCEDDRPPSAPDPGGGPGGSGGGTSGGGGDDDGDGGPGDGEDAGDPAETICRELSDGDPNDFIANFFGGAVVAGSPSRLGVFWDCVGRPSAPGANGQLLVTLGNDSVCSFTAPGTLSMRFLASELGSRVATGGAINLAPEPDLVDVLELSLFLDPSGGGVVQEWGTCNPMTTGTLTIEDASDVAGERFRILDLDATLQPCGTPGDPAIAVDASIDFDLPSRFTDVCG